MVSPRSVGGWLSVWWLVVGRSVGRLVRVRSVVGQLVGVGQPKVGGWLSDWWLVCWSVCIRLLVVLFVSWFWLVGRPVGQRLVVG